jgi:hypothetical protein
MKMGFLKTSNFDSWNVFCIPDHVEILHNSDDVTFTVAIVQQMHLRVPHSLIWPMDAHVKNAIFSVTFHS